MKLICGLVFVILMTITSSTADKQGRMHNGVPATQAVPYHAHLKFLNTLLPETEYTGSGILISDIHVITSATNIRGFNQWSAGFGGVHVDELIYFEATGAIVHENYNPLLVANNIGIIFFGAGINSNVVTIAPVSLPLLNEQVPVSGTIGNFVAFGYTSPTGELSEELLQGQQQVFTTEDCANLFPLGDFINQFCAVDLSNFSTPCNGDQGAGFVQVIRNQPVLVGLVSSVAGNCNLATAITFYTRVTNFRLWLLTTFGI